MLAEKIEFPVEITDSKGAVKVVSSDKLYEVVLKRNLKAASVTKLFNLMGKLHKGETVNGDELNFKGMTFRRKS
jgi:hypothetical protein